MKLLMYGVNKETVTKEDVEKYLLNENSKKRQMKDISQLKGVEEVVVLTNDFRNEYYLYVDESIFSHGDFLRYIAKRTGKKLQEIILETYSKFNEDVLRHLFEISSGYLTSPSGSFHVLASVEQALEFADAQQTCGPISYKMFEKAIVLAYTMKLKNDIKPLNQSNLSKYIYLLKEKMKHLEKKNYLVSGSDLQVYFLTKTLLMAGAQTVTIVQENEYESQGQYDEIKSHFNEIERSKVFPATKKSLYFRLSKADAAILDPEKLGLFAKEIREEVAIIRRTKKVQYLVDTTEEPFEKVEFPGLDL